ncbi:glutamine synthetase family protein [Roseinatronobacter alkalisoli]|uniref:Glutamine synthetase family protein n=1 Tax=Roseinatronobacter alkalisoli TaxID=3028235 RepID=A0ABT5TD66_9RHOB|nr:glutamine synthetase family protein [Roseinatronobacter sp. HJB301]MDD7972919.1 glutamine synthetase family protein [Roseinatronobacter sp. HJB301]
MTPTAPLQKAPLSEAQGFLAAYPDVQAIDIILSDLHGIGRGKIIRRHELESLFTSGRGMPASLFAQDVSGHDVDAAIAVMTDGGGDSRCWPVPHTLGYQTATGRGMVLLQMETPEGAPTPFDPRNAMMTQIARAVAMGYTPMGALELEFYLIDKDRDAVGKPQPARAPMTGRRLSGTNCMSVDELDEMAPFFDAVYEGAAALDLPMESLISEYAVGQFELTLRYRELARAADDIVRCKRLLRTTARRFGMEACFMSKPFAQSSGSGMHLHLSMTDASGVNIFADPADGTLSPRMLSAIGGVRDSMAESMLVLAPVLNSWRRFAGKIYSPAANTWGAEDRNVALRIPSGAPKTRHFEHRVAGVDANPYLVAAIVLGAALDGIDAGKGPGAEGPEGAADYPAMPGGWLDAINRFDGSTAMKSILGAPLHQMFAAVKRGEHYSLSMEVTELEWQLYGTII